jgi:hypothetical protein
LHIGIARLRQLRVERLQVLEPGFGGRAALARDLAPDEVVGLDAGGALVDGRDPRVAQVLGGAGS